MREDVEKHIDDAFEENIKESTSIINHPPTTTKASLGRGHRKKTLSIRLRDFITDATIRSSPFDQSPSSSKSLGVSYPIQNFVNCNSFSKQHCIFLGSLHTEQEPLYFSQVVRDERWREAMSQEIRALEINDM